MDRIKQRYGHYTSPQYQNDLIHALATCVRENIISRIERYFAILVDEAKDRSKKEQLCFVLRYTKSGSIYENVIGSYHMKQLDAKSLADEIHRIVVSECGLDWSKCVAQCYDGASVMSGKFSGVQTRIREKAPQALYIHCHAHRLNLTLTATLMSITEITQFFSMIQAIYVFLTRSSPRHEVFV